MLAFKHGKLLAKSQVLQQQASASAEDARECPEPEPEQVDHDSKVIADGILVRAPRLLISKPDGIVASDKYGASPRPNQQPLAYKLLPQHAVLFLEVVDHVALVLVQPAGERNQQ
jgi:acyl-CoA thioesterase